MSSVKIHLKLLYFIRQKTHGYPPDFGRVSGSGFKAKTRGFGFGYPTRRKP
jgi:hypothetical protein